MPDFRSRSFWTRALPFLHTSRTASVSNGAWKHPPNISSDCPDWRKFDQHFQQLEQHIADQAAQLQAIPQPTNNSKPPLMRAFQIFNVMTLLETIHANSPSCKRMDLKATPPKRNPNALPSQADLDRVATMTPFATAESTTSSSTPPTTPTHHTVPRPAPYQAQQALTSLGKTRSSGTASPQAAPRKP